MYCRGRCGRLGTGLVLRMAVRVSVHLQVLTAQQLPKLNAEKPNSIVDPLVRVEIHGVPADCARRETSYVLNNGRWAGG